MTALGEAQRQAALLAAIGRRPAAADLLRLSGPGDRAALAMAVYRQQADATAAKALANIFPTLQALLGAVQFERLAVEFRQVASPLRGDLGEWGADLPDFVDGHQGLVAWPWLGDTARLDLAVHRSERAADAAFDADSMALLATADPESLRLELMPGSALLRSAWPIVALHSAHRLEAPAAAAAFPAVAAAIAARCGECAWVVRRGWQAAVHPVDEVEAGWLESVLAGERLASALRRAGAGFSFAAWLAEAVRDQRVRGIVRLR